jgi:hypothetical protein
MQIAGIGPRELSRGQIESWQCLSPACVCMPCRYYVVGGCAEIPLCGRSSEVACPSTLFCSTTPSSIRNGQGRQTENSSFDIHGGCIAEVLNMSAALWGSITGPLRLPRPTYNDFDQTRRLEKVASLTKEWTAGLGSCIRGDAAASTRTTESVSRRARCPRLYRTRVAAYWSRAPSVHPCPRPM